MYSKWGTGHPLNNEEKTKHSIAAVQESPRQAGTEQGRHPVQRMRWQCEDVVKDSKRHRHKEIELRLLRTVTPAFPNSLLLGFANLAIVGLKGGCIFVHLYMVHTLSTKSYPLTEPDWGKDTAMRLECEKNPTDFWKEGRNEIWQGSNKWEIDGSWKIPLSKVERIINLGAV